jgi:preprotein translocase subunit YajC
VDNVIPFAIIAALLVLMIFSMRRQAKRSRAAQETRAAVEVGSDVITTSGLYGRVVALSDTTIDLEVSERVVVRFARAAVREIVSSADSALAESAGDDDAFGGDEVDEEPLADHDTRSTAFADSSGAADTVSRADSDGTPR